MSTTKDYIEYVAEHVSSAVVGRYSVRYRKMFGEYMLYINEKPLVLVCDNTVYVRRRAEILTFLEGKAGVGFPYDGAKEHYILDVDDAEVTAYVLIELEKNTRLPKPKVKKSLKSTEDIADDTVCTFRGEV